MARDEILHDERGSPEVIAQGPIKTSTLQLSNGSNGIVVDPDTPAAYQPPALPVHSNHTSETSPIESKDSNGQETQDFKRKSHIPNLETFVQDMNDRVEGILDRRRSTPYKEVRAFITYWEDGKDLDELRREAKELSNLFKDVLGFNTICYKIPRKVNGSNHALALVNAVQAFHGDISQDSDSLFIMYYGGHAARDKRGHPVWMSENANTAATLVWSDVVGTVFRESQCQKLFILDCCHAGDMIDRRIDWEGSCEVLGACSGDVQASAVGKFSFTRAVRIELAEMPYEVTQLHSVLVDSRSKYDLKAQPWYMDMMGQHRTAVIRRFSPNLETASDPHTRLSEFTAITARVLIQVKFEGSVKGFLQRYKEICDDWKLWIKHTPGVVRQLALEALDEVELAGIWKSDSCTTIWSLPLWLWNTMTPTDACVYLGVVRSRNRLPKEFALPTLRSSRWAEIPPSSAVTWPKHLSPRAHDQYTDDVHQNASQEAQRSGSDIWAKDSFKPLRTAPDQSSPTENRAPSSKPSKAGHQQDTTLQAWQELRVAAKIFSKSKAPSPTKTRPLGEKIEHMSIPSSRSRRRFDELPLPARPRDLVAG
jgi:hypothetical protein